MPIFQLDRGERPESLNPLNPYHYGLLAYWVFFRPSVLRSYLYKASPDLYRQSGWSKFRGSFKVPGYRNLYLMATASVMKCLFLLAFTFSLYTLAVNQGHTGSINSVLALSNTQVISASGRDFTGNSSLKVWDLDRGALLQTVPGNRSGINALALLSGDRVISGGGDRAVNIWDIKGGDRLKSLENHSRWIEDLAVTPDQKLAISASADNTLIVWNIESGNKLHILEGHTGPVNSVTLTPDGTQAISGSADGTVKIWNLEQGTLLQTLSGHTTEVKAVTLTPNGEQVISASLDGSVKVWVRSSGTEVQNLTAHPGGVNTIAVTPDGQQVISGGADGTVKVWTLNDGTLQYELTGHQGWINGLAVTPDGQQVVSASSDHTLKVWNLQQGTLVHTLVGHQEWVRSVAVTPDGQRVISGAGDRLPKVWDLTSGEEIPLKAVQRTLFWTTLGFVFGGVFLWMWIVLASALILTCSFMVLGLAGSVLAALVLALLGSFAFTSLFILNDLMRINPPYEQTFGAIVIDTPLLTVGFAIFLGTLWFMAFAIAGRTAVGLFAGVGLILVLAIAIGAFDANVLKAAQIGSRGRFVSVVSRGIEIGVFFNLLVAIGSLRLLFYPIELIAALNPNRRGDGHPVLWDELLVLPLPNSHNALIQQLQRDEKEGLHRIAEVCRNPFQRSVALKALSRYLHSTPNPLHLLYAIARDSDLRAYLWSPVSAEDWRGVPERRQVLLGGLGFQQVNCGSDWLNQVSESWVGVLPWVWRSHRQTPLTRFSALLYQLLNSESVNRSGLDLTPYKQNLLSLRDYPGGVEILESLTTLATLSSLDDLSDLRIALETLRESELAAFYEGEADSRMPVAGVIRPEVLNAIARLGEIGTLISSNSEQPDSVKRLATLARATVALDTLESEAIATWVTPEQGLLQQIIHQWRQLLLRETADAAKIAV
ncbi:WD40 repeat domain-containing protein [Oscillatoria acuminata]|uniref:WD40 repeat-containing protein n=1 Tax=Oscillatoria acuminata PCC 6304 TaxID=56110 RepID=K9TD66_9CYAN|nr:WD40 repeat domain-containing protein [Oscillatoria acuminata]AFY80081.1 WD40 repeat-containing protein [Oscillatoria acuminata PCC 6304]